MGRLGERKGMRADSNWNAYYFADQSHEQIAETLEIDVRAVGTALHKARMKLDLLLDVNAKGAS